jgi:thioredoxin reductase (NADPH)
VSTDFEILVAGGGIAGLTAGLVAARLGRRTLILTGDQLGGNLLSIEKIEGYPGFPDGVAGFELCPITQGQAAEAGAEFETAEVLDLRASDGTWTVATSAGDFAAGAVILATGSRLRTLGVPGEEQLKGKGVSHCASCDAPLLRERPVIVIGGGDSACQEALTLAEAASQVTLLQRGAELTAQASYRDRVRAHPKIALRFDTSAEEILGGDAVTGVRLAGGEVIAADGVFIYVGLAPNTAFLNGKLVLDSNGRIPTDSEMRTALAGVFAAGSVRTGWPGRAVAAAGDGTAAAIAAHDYLADGA